MKYGRATVKDSVSAPSLALSALVRPAAEKTSALEGEVVALFDEYRAPLLRYALSFGLTAADGEEVVQEVFLSLFRHLRDGKSRSNLRGWLFRVSHNMALKRRQRAQGGAESLGPNRQRHVGAFQSDRKSTRLNSSHVALSRMPSSA